MKVVLQDPRHRQAGGRTPYKKPLSDPCEVIEVHGNTMTVRRKDGSLVKDVHSENVVVVPDSVKDLERPDLTFEDEDDPLVPCGENFLNLGVWQGARNHYIGSHRTGAPRPRTWTVTWRSRSPSGKGLARPW